MVALYRCVHCNREIAVQENGEPESCSDHPNAPIELVTPDTEDGA